MELALITRQPLSEFSTLSAEEVSTVIDIWEKINGNTQTW